MESIRKKAGYLEGLVSGMKLDESDPSAQLTMGMVSLLSDMADRLEGIDELLVDLNEYVESIDDDLSELEGIHDDDEDGDFDIDIYPDEEPEKPLRLIRNNDAPAAQPRLACCKSCEGVFYITGKANQKYFCPYCSEDVRVKVFNTENTPTVDPESK